VTKDEWAAKRQVTPARGKQAGPLQAAIDELGRSLADHISRWRTAEGGWALVLQPYHFEVEHMRAIVELCERHGFEAEIDPLANWHHPEVVGVVLRAQA
jgi:hypothetical protein